jgi:hypothetical protein
MLLNCDAHKRSLVKSPRVTYMRVSKFDKRFLLVGYANGSVDIFSANDLKFLYYRSQNHKSGEFGAVKSIHFETSMMKENLSYLAVLHHPLYDLRS